MAAQELTIYLAIGIPSLLLCVAVTTHAGFLNYRKRNILRKYIFVSWVFTAIASILKFILPFIHECHRHDIKVAPPNVHACSTVWLEAVMWIVNNLGFSALVWCAIELSSIVLSSSTMKVRPPRNLFRILQVACISMLIIFTIFIIYIMYEEPNSTYINKVKSNTRLYVAAYSLGFLAIIFSLVVSFFYILKLKKEIYKCSTETSKDDARAVFSRAMKYVWIFGGLIILSIVSFVGITNLPTQYPWSVLRISTLVLAMSCITGFQFAMLTIINMNVRDKTSVIPIKSTAILQNGTSQNHNGSVPGRKYTV
ncbi:hypothetical protein BKA69DRAFT_1087406 [Paraphysoderma sedebokerense]|nr:hypothetical protein BKA69DRAFT_1087406 [Paraphysoderma sedebokerense]